MRFRLDKFKKVSSDENHTVLQHPAGHQIKVMHSALSPDNRKQLDEMPIKKMDKGGDVLESDKKEDNQKSKDETDAMGGLMEQGIYAPSFFGSAPSVAPSPKEYADGSPGVPGGSGSPAIDPKKAKAIEDGVNKSLGDRFKEGVENLKSGLGIKDEPESESKGGQVKRYAEGTPDAPIQQDDSSIPAAMGITGAPQASAPAPMDSAPQEAVPAAAPQAMPANPALAAPGAPPQAPADPFGTQVASDVYMKGIGEQKAGLQGQAEAAGAEGQAQAASLASAADAQQKVLQSYQEHYKGLESERQNFIKDVQNNLIDPKHYMNSMGTGQRISTAIGLILGGMGSGLAGGSNPAADFLKAQIKRDIEAQSKKLGERERLLSANMRQFGNLRDATDMTRVMQNDIVSNQLKEAAAKAATPMAKANAIMAAGKLDNESANTIGMMTARRTLIGGMQSGHVDPARVVNLIIPPEQRAQANKEMQEAQMMSAARDNLLSSFDKLSQINTVGNRAAHLGFTPPQVSALRDPLLASLSKQTAGRFTDSDAHMLKPLFPQMGDSAETLAIKRAQLTKLVNEKMAPDSFPILKTYGIDLGNAGRYNSAGQGRIKESAPVKK